jgi:metallo-beta-lactamase family protein
LRNNIEDPRNTVLITGFQAEHTLGRKLVNKLPEVQIFGEPMRLRAEVQSLDSLSGHADQAGLIEWTRPLVPALRQVFLVHGEPKQSAALTQKLREELGVNVQPAPPGLSFDL